MDQTFAELERQLPNQTILTSKGQGWQGVTVQQYRLPSGSIALPTGCDDRLTLHLSGPAFLDRHCGGHRVRFWSDGGQVCINPAGAQMVQVTKGLPDVLKINLGHKLVQQVASSIFDRDPEQVVLIERFGILDKTLNDLGRLLLAEAQTDDSATLLASESIAVTLIVRLLREHSNMAPGDAKLASGLSRGRMKRVVDYMRMNMNKDLTLTALSNISGLSTSQFVRAFRVRMGITPHRYLTSIRIERARTLLEETDLSVIQIGLQCGYNLSTHFATAFRKVTGMSPREWRTMRRL